MNGGEPVVISLQVGGIADVKRAFQSISDLVFQSAQKTTRAAQDGDRAAVKSAQAAAKEKERVAKAAQKASEAAEKAKVKAAETAEKLKAKAADAAAQATVRAWLKSDRDVERIRIKSQRDAERAEIAKTRVVEREEAKKTRITEREEKKRAATAEREAKKVARAKEREAKAADRDGQKARSAFAGQLMGGVGRIGGGAAMLGGLAATVGGGFTIADAVQRSMQSSKAAASLANAMFNPNDAEQAKYLNGARFDTKQIMGFAGRAHAESGVDKAEFMTGVQDYIAKSSDWKAVATGEGQQTLVDLAKLSKASGADFGQVMSAAGSLRVQNKDLDPKAMMDMMYSIVGQGKMGAVEIKDLAQHAAVITSSSGGYKIGAGGYRDQAQAQAGLLGLSQIAVQTSGSAAEAATAVKSFSGDLNAKAGKAEANFSGLKLRDKEHKLLKVSDLAQNIFEATNGDVSRMGEGKGNIGLGRESIRIMQALDPIYTNALAKEREALASDKDWGKKGKAEREVEARKRASKAVGDEVRRFEGASYSKGDADKDFQVVSETPGAKLEKTLGHLADVTETKVLPFVERFANSMEKNGPKIEKVLDVVASFAGKVAENPISGIGAIIGTAIAADIAKAQLGTMVSKALETSMGSKLGGGIAIAGAAIAITQVGMMAIDTVMDQKAKEQSRNAMAFRDVDTSKNSIQRKLSSGEALTQDEIAAAQKQLTEGRAKVAQMKEANKSDATFDKYLQIGVKSASAVSTLGQYDLSEGMGEAAKAKQQAAAASTKRTEDSLNELAAALAKATEAAKANAAANAGGKANPNDPSRSAPLSSGARGGTQ